MKKNLSPSQQAVLTALAATPGLELVTSVAGAWYQLQTAHQRDVIPRGLSRATVRALATRGLLAASRADTITIWTLTANGRAAGKEDPTHD